MTVEAEVRRKKDYYIEQFPLALATRAGESIVAMCAYHDGAYFVTAWDREWLQIETDRRRASLEQAMVEFISICAKLAGG